MIQWVLLCSFPAQFTCSEFPNNWLNDSGAMERQVVCELNTGARTSCHAIDLQRRVQSVMQRVGKPVPLFLGPEDRPVAAGRDNERNPE
jgi:hypothetical protein